ncbi:hypothetical protein [Acidocella sp.]|uniref:hypothetical protein n=1 Tax=Acidocella sp. TaxID=50710 RepID=UPI00260B7478|nr:hypothetical protein [Acidocella sp.]
MQFPIGNVITSVATVIAVVISNKLSSSQSGQAKLWELRRQAYGVILSELATVERICRSIDSYIEESATRYYESDERNSMDSRRSLHMGVMFQRFSDDYLIISQKFVELFEDFTAELYADPGEIFPISEDSEENFSATVRKHKPLLLAQGRTEIAVGNEFRRYLNILRWLHVLKSRVASFLSMNPD